MKAFLDANCQKRSCFIVGQFPEEDKSFQREYTTIPFGLSQQIVKSNSSQSTDQMLSFDTEAELKAWLQENDKALPTFQLPIVTPPQKYSASSQIVINDYWYAYHLRALTILNFARRHDNSKEYLEIALNIYEQ
jgi:hypothetical protein